MQNIVLINPLQTGKLNVFKAFMAEITGPRREEYTDLLKRYGLKNSKCVYHKLGNDEFIVVIHELESYALERLPAWITSAHPFDIWFREQSQRFYDFEKSKIAGQPQVIAAFDPTS